MRLSRILGVLLLALIAVGYLCWSWSTILGGFGGDNANYLLMTQYYSPYGEASAAAKYFSATSIYPPLFPLLLALLGGGQSLLLAHLITTSFLLAAFALFYYWLKREQISTRAALISLLALALLPGLYFQTLSILSENLYTLFTLAALLGLSSAQKRPSFSWILLAVVFIAAAYLTRTAGVALIGASLIWLWLHRVPRKILFSLLLILPPVLWGQLGNSAATNYWQHLLNGYHDPAGMLDQVVLQSRYLFEGWKVNFGDSRASAIAGTATLITGLAGAIWRIRHGYADGFYALFYIVMAALWPFPAEAQRLTIAILPVLLLQSICIMDKWRLAEIKVKPVLLALLATILIAVIPELVLNFNRFKTPLPEEVPSAYKHAEWWYAADIESASANIQAMAALENGIRNLRTKVPDNECIFAIKPSVIAYLSGHKSVPPPGSTIDPDTFETTITNSPCRYFYMIVYTSPSYATPLYPYERLQEQLEIIEPTFLSSNPTDSSIVALLARLK